MGQQKSKVSTDKRKSNDFRERAVHSAAGRIDTQPNENLYDAKALCLAAGRNDIPRAEKLLSQRSEYGLRIGKDELDRTPLHYAAMNNVNESHFRVAQLLLKHGADINAKDNLSQTPLYLLVMNGNVRIVKFFLNCNPDVKAVCQGRFNLLFPAARNNNNVDVLQLLIGLGLNVNHRNSVKSTPLHYACQFISHQNTKIIKCLLKSGADINALDINEYTPLIDAVYANKKFSSLGEMGQKNFKLIIEHSDFSVIQNYINIFTFNYDADSDCLWRMILEHIAKLQVLNLPVHPKDLLNTVSNQELYNNYLIRCKEELLRAKNTKLPNSLITFYNLLIDDRRKLKNYGGNRELIEDFRKSDFERRFPIYGAAMNENLTKGIKKRELFDKSSILLSDCLPVFNPSHLIIKDILDCVISKKCLLKFCEYN